MAYGLRYQSDFYNYFGTLVSVKIYKQDYSDSVEDDLRLSEVTIESNYQDDNTPIIGKGAKIVIEANEYEMGFLNEMLISYERQFLCTITYGGQIVFRGFSICDLNERQLLPYGKITMQFTDYLKRLEDKYPNSLSDIAGKSIVYALVNEMLGLTDMDLPLYVNSTLFEDSMTKAVTDTFLAQTCVQNAQFYENSYDFNNIFEAVNKALHPFSAYLYSYNDMWVLERQEDITRVGNWVQYDTGGATEIGSLRQSIYKQGSGEESFEYVDCSQVVEYDSGLHTLILELHDKILDTLVFNNFTTEIETVDSATSGLLTKNVWYADTALTNIDVGTNRRGIEQWIRFSSASATTGLYYSFELQFNAESDETTELTVSYKMSGDGLLFMLRKEVSIQFYLRLDGGSQADHYIYEDQETGEWKITDSVMPVDPFDAVVFKTVYDCTEKRTTTWDISFTGDLYDIWEDLGFPTTQKFILIVLPGLSNAFTVGDPTTVFTNTYVGDFQVTVNETALDNKIEYQLNQNFVKTDEIELHLFDWNNINYSNGLLLSDEETLTSMWTSENSPDACPLYEIFAKTKFRKYGRTIHRLKGTILIDKPLKPFCMISDDTILNESGTVITFLLNGFTWDLNKGIYDIEAEEYIDEDVTVVGASYDSSGNPVGEWDPPAAPTGLTLSQVLFRRAVYATWNTVGNAQGYRLYRKPFYSTLSSSWVDTYKLVYSGTANTFLDMVTFEGDPTGQTFTYKVCAYNAVGNGDDSTEETLVWS